MDKTQFEILDETCGTADTNLPAVMAGLEMLTVNTNLSPTKNTRIFTKEIPKDESNDNLNRRCSLRPRKRSYSEVEDISKRNKSQQTERTNFKEYYLNKNLKRRLNNLETIYEEKDDANEFITYMSVKRYKRMIQFQEKPTDSKLRKRRAKIKSVFGSKINFKQRRASMQMLLEKLNGIRSESPAKVDSEAK
ncbi:hypothetical protein WN48_09859 [Eufriesea mexicana]|uniref:uncharacterized protein LOC108546628 n=1 Tax=Eufriesea mexicana TaxID=516756 RepID=UPI00083BE67D|nr:PREDICTED: uncharacterized protein LOC108546628 [Eufriesea mexicana]OAD58932.1 hypothetical protein WN48_09859 [Eufriesea mexicana]